MSLEFEFPDTGEGVTEGKFLKWLIEEGDSIEEDEVVAEVETDKAVVDIPAPADGEVKDLKVEPGDNVEVGEVIMEMETGEIETEESSESEQETETESEEAEDSESPDTEDREDKEEPSDHEKKVEEELGPEFLEDHDSGNPSQRKQNGSSSGKVLALPKVRKLAEEKNVDLASIKTEERIMEKEVLEAAGSTSHETEETQKEHQDKEESEKTESTEETTESSSSSDVKATPAVRKLAREKEIDISSIEGSGRGGKVTRNDVLKAAEEETVDEQVSENEKGTAETEIETETRTEAEDEERVDLTGIRKAVGQRMKESRFTAPHVTHTDKADVSKLVELREREKDEVDVHLTYLPFIMKATLSALQEHPRLNAELDEEEDEIIMKKHYDFNIAADTEKGLMIPLIEDVDDKSIVELAEKVNEKAGKARDGDLSPDEMRNGTFAITNVGVIGGESFTPIINYPQVAILGLGKIQETAEVVDGEVEPRHTVKLSLSYDHRVVDGADAARFMNTIIENLESPEKMLLEQ